MSESAKQFVGKMSAKCRDRSLAFSDPEYLSPALRTCATRSGPLILERHLLWICNLNLLSALHAVSLHHDCPSFVDVCEIVQVKDTSCQGVGGS